MLDMIFIVNKNLNFIVKVSLLFIQKIRAHCQAPLLKTGDSSIRTIAAGIAVDKSSYSFEQVRLRIWVSSFQMHD